MQPAAAEHRHQPWFAHAPVALVVLDLSSLEHALDEMRRLQRSTTELRSHLAANPDEVFRLASQARVVDVNEAALDLLECDSIEELRMRLPACCDAPLAVALAGLFADLERGAERLDLEFRLTTARGTERCLSVALGLGCGQEPPGTAIAFLAQASPGRRSDEEPGPAGAREAALREQEALVRSVIDNLPETMVYQIEAQPGGTRRFTYVSDAVRSLFGCAPEEVIADPELIYSRIVDRERVRAEEERALRRLSPFRAELLMRGPSGRLGWAYAASAARQRPDGTTVWDGIVTDITERKRIEADRERLIEALHETERRRNEFLGVLSHELRGPLAPMRNSLFVLERAPDVEQARSALAVMDRQIQQLCRLLDDLLDVTRISRGKIRLELERLRLDCVVGEALEDARAELDARGIELRGSLGGGPYWVEGDRTRLGQVVANLLSNAMKFTPRGGRVEVSLERQGPQAALRVRDTGVGLAPEALRQMFQPFFQTPQSLARTSGGLGLGLALVKGLVELHGGAVGASSAGEGQGAEFIVRLPLQRGPAAQPSPDEPSAGPAAPATARRRRVLIVEDDLDSARSLQSLLELMGHDVRTAHEGRTGLELARTFQPEVVFCDVGLPGMSGYELARAFCADEALRGIRLVALTGYARPEDHQRAAEAGFTQHLAKPASVESLESVLAAD